MTRRKWIGFGLGFLGVLPISLHAHTKQHSWLNNPLTIFEDFDFEFTTADLMTVGAVFAFAIGWILLKGIVSHKQAPSYLTANGLSMVFGGILALLHSVFEGETWNPLPVSNMAKFFELNLILALISNVICYNLYGYLLKKYSSTFMSYAGLVTPLFASLFGWAFLNEVISIDYFVTMAFFLTGLVVFHGEETQTKYSKKSRKIKTASLRG